MIANYHTHTHRCHHATGTEEEYVLQSINNGIKILGFSEHAPFIFPDGYESMHRLPMAEVKEYFNTLSALREKYKDKLEMHIGFEMEYFPPHFDEMFGIAKSVGAEYLILGQHFLGNEHPNGRSVLMDGNNEQDLIEYVDCVISAIKTEKFLYVAHPDIFKFDGDYEIYYREMKRLCLAAKEHNTPLEINFLGIFDNRIYPADKFWKIAKEVGVDVVFGCDAHCTKNAFNPDVYKKALDFAKKHNISVLEKLDIEKRNIQGL